jgi:hypothetical protein
MADGVEDGNLYPVLATRVGHEGRLHRRMKGAQDRAADHVTAFAGSLNFVYLHAFWFGLWIVCNTGLFGRRLEFDRFPFGLLTMVVSLEAIFLSTFVMVSQNRQAARSDIRSQLDFETNLRAEIWAVHIGHAAPTSVRPRRAEPARAARRWTPRSATSAALACRRSAQGSVGHPGDEYRSRTSTMWLTNCTSKSSRTAAPAHPRRA